MRDLIDGTDLCKKHHNMAFYKPILTKMSIWSKKGCIISLAEYSALPRTRGGAAW